MDAGVWRRWGAGESSADPEVCETHELSLGLLTAMACGYADGTWTASLHVELTDRPCDSFGVWERAGLATLAAAKAAAVGEAVRLADEILGRAASAGDPSKRS